MREPSAQTVLREIECVALLPLSKRELVDKLNIIRENLDLRIKNLIEEIRNEEAI
jgi:hypothetical protein